MPRRNTIAWQMKKKMRVEFKRFISSTFISQDSLWCWQRTCVSLWKRTGKKEHSDRWKDECLVHWSGQRSVIGSAVNNRCAFVWLPYLELLSRYITTAVDVILPPDLQQEMLNQCKQMWTVDLCEYIYHNLIWHRGGIRWWRLQYRMQFRWRMNYTQTAHFAVTFIFIRQ